MPVQESPSPSNFQSQGDVAASELDLNVAVPGNGCYEFILYDSYGDGMCCANGVGSVLVTDPNGLIIFEGDPVNLQNFSVIPTPFST